jgi:hypothetical protein
MLNIQEQNYMEERMLYKPITKCQLCGEIFEPNIDGSNSNLLKTYTYLHQCDARYNDKKGIGVLIGFTILPDAILAPLERTEDESNRVQDLKDSVKPQTG